MKGAEVNAAVARVRLVRMGRTVVHGLPHAERPTSWLEGRGHVVACWRHGRGRTRFRDRDGGLLDSYSMAVSGW